MRSIIFDGSDDWPQNSYALKSNIKIKFKKK